MTYMLHKVVANDIYDGTEYDVHHQLAVSCSKSSKTTTKEWLEEFDEIPTDSTYVLWQKLEDCETDDSFMKRLVDAHIVLDFELHYVLHDTFAELVEVLELN